MSGSFTAGLIEAIGSHSRFTVASISKMGWMGHTPNGWKRMLDRSKAGAELVVVDPRRAETARKATRRVAMLIGTDWAFLLALLSVIFREGLEWIVHADQIAHVDELRALTMEQDIAALSERCGIPADDLIRLARDFAAAPRAHAVVHTGSSMTASGTVYELLTIALNLVTGRIEAPGGRFMPGWPAHMPAVAREGPAGRPPRPSRVRGLMPAVGAYSMAELPGEIETPGEGQIRALILNGANPVASGPDGTAMDRALGKLDPLVSIDLLQRESHRNADWLIPTAHFLEREEFHVYLHSTGDRPFVQSGRAVAPLPDGVIADWEFLLRLGDALEAPLFGGAVRTPDNFSDMKLKLSGLTTAEVRSHPHGLFLGEWTTGHLWADLADAGNKADICPAEYASELRRLISEPAPDPAYTFRIISRRRNSTMNAWLADMTDEKEGSGVAEIAHADAQQLGLKEGAQVRVSSVVGSLDLVVRLSDELASGVVLIEHGWGTRVFDPVSGEAAFSSGTIRNRLVDNSVLEPFSGTPRLNGMPVKVEPI